MFVNNDSYQINGNRGIFLPFQLRYHAKEAQRAKVAQIGVALEGEKGGGVDDLFQYLIKIVQFTCAHAHTHKDLIHKQCVRIMMKGS